MVQRKNLRKGRLVGFFVVVFVVRFRKVLMLSYVLPGKSPLALGCKPSQSI